MTEIPTQEIDLGAVVAEATADVYRRRSSGQYSADLLTQLDADFAPYGSDVGLGELARVETVRPVESSRRWLGPIAVFAKRVVRRLVAWYIRPIAVDQTIFNFSVVRRLADLDERIIRLEPVWRRLAQAPAIEGAAGMELSRSRAEAVRTALGRAPQGPVIVTGRASAAVADELSALGLSARTMVGNVLQALTHDAGAPAAVLMLAGVVPMLGAADLLSLIPVAAAKVLPGGILLVDAPDASRVDDTTDPGVIDPAFQRWVSPETLRVLCEAAGLEVLDVAREGGRSAAWYTVIAKRPPSAS